MKIIIFAGGTGKRFWPASRKKSPKQFLPVIGEKPLIRLKFEYLLEGFAIEDIYLSTGVQFENEVRSILPELPEENIILEPEMRDNGPAVAYAVAYVMQQFPDEIVSIQWSDHYIKKPKIFVKALQKAEEIVKNEQKTVIIGERPRFASPHLGYIKFGDHLKNLNGSSAINLATFKRFVEKPTKEVAQEYIQSGDYSWNLGYFVTTTTILMEKYKTFAPQIYETVQSIAADDFSEEAQEQYRSLEKVSFDVIFAENLNEADAYVITTDMGWNDVGTWIQLKEALESSSQSNVVDGNVVDVDSHNSLIYNYDKNKLVTTINLNGMVVVNTPDAIAVFPQEDNTRIKELLKKLEEQGYDEYL